MLIFLCRGHPCHHGSGSLLPRPITRGRGSATGAPWGQTLWHWLHVRELSGESMDNSVLAGSYAHALSTTDTKSMQNCFLHSSPSRTHGRTPAAYPTQLHRKRTHPHNERALYVHVHNSDSIKQTHGARTRVYTRSQTIHSVYPIHRDVYARGQQIPNTRTF